MKIFFVANPVSGLYKVIQAEMQRQGHEVTLVMDKLLAHDPYLRRGISFPCKKWIWEFLLKRYWDKMLTDNKLYGSYDLLFMISGTSVSNYLVALLKSKNPWLKVVLYTWDGCEHYSFDRHLIYADKAYTFEMKDVLKDSRWILKPIFCSRAEDSKKKNADYDLFMIGSNHDGRYSFIKKILPQLKKSGVTYYIKIFAVPPKSGLKIIFYNIFHAIKNQGFCEELRFSRGLENDDLLLTDPVPPEEYNNILNSARCVLDDQREGQSGLTARFMWALAVKKKIVTTNEWALSYDFVSPRQVVVISKQCPQLPVDFLRSNLIDDDCSDISNFYVDKWVEDILNV